MYFSTFSLISILLVYGVFCKNVGNRDPRFLRGTYISTKTDTSTVTSVVPSSCARVDPTLPPCRNIRFLPSWSKANTNTTTTNDIQSQPESKSDLMSTSLGWGEYLGIYAPTVTVTQTKLVTTVVTDPRVVMTYAVKGCRPLQLPENLDRCPIDDSVVISSVLATSTITPSATVAVGTPANSKVINVAGGTSFPVTDISENPINSNLEPSAGDLENVNTGRQARATDPLPF